MTSIAALFRALHQNQRGQILPWAVVLLVIFLGMAGLTIDLGHGYICYRELQASTDASAMAGAYAMTLAHATSDTVKAEARLFSSVPGNRNANTNLPSVSITPTLKCVISSSLVNIPCAASWTGDNVIQVQQTATIPTLFIRALAAFGVDSAKTLTLTAISTATLVGSTNNQYDVVIVVDSTGSMSQQDSDAACRNMRITCALHGVQTMLRSLTPCALGSTKTNCVAFDQVSLFTYPNIAANSAKYDTSCSSGNPNIVPYSTPTIGAAWSPTDFTKNSPTYQLTSFLDDYSSTNLPNGKLNTSSSLSIATGAGNCAGIDAKGGEDTYFAGVIYAAQSALVAQHALYPSAQSAMIILSDGDANAVKSDFQTAPTNTDGTYPSLKNECQQAVTAAQYAANDPTTHTQVYTVAYGASNSKTGSCGTDGGAISACQALQEMASSSANFYSDATASQNKGQCLSTDNPNLTLDQIFQKMQISFTKPRLIPNSAVQ